jgi:DNA-binding response OmpR family regulator
MAGIDKKINVLVVEEDAGEITAFENFFKSLGSLYRYTVSTSVANAVRQLKIKRFDAVISELSFIDGSVFHLLPLARRTPFIVITAKGDEELAVKAIQKGAAEYLLRDVERNYLKVLPSMLIRAARHKRNEMLIDIFLGALNNIDKGVCVFKPQGEIIFANKSFCQVFDFKTNYYLRDIKELLDEHEITLEPDLKKHLEEKEAEESCFLFQNPQKGQKGSLRLVPVDNRCDGLLGYVCLLRECEDIGDGK